MNAAQVFGYFDRVSEAVDAIPRLRRFILHLAVSGKLARPSADWKSVTLGDVGEWGSGGTPAKSHPEYYGGHIPWLVIGDLNNSVVMEAQTHITDAGLKNSSAKLVEPGTILVAMYGSIGKLGIAGIRCATNQAIAYCVPDETIVIKQYLMLLLNALREDLLAKGQGGAQQNISQKILKSHPVRLPPLADQCAIVAEVDERMVLCDRLQAARNEREATRSRLTTASLARLNEPDVDPAIFSDDAHFALDNLAHLTTRPDQVPKLRQTILNLAVRGKLVTQDVADEPASALLRRTAMDKQRRVTERKIRSSKTPLTVSKGDIPADLPETWEMRALGDVALVIDPNPSHRYPPYERGSVPILSTQEFAGRSGWNPSTAKLVRQEFCEFQNEICGFSAGDIIFARKGRLGLPRHLPPLPLFAFSHTVFVIKPLTGVLPSFLLWSLRRIEAVHWLTSEMNQNTGVPTLGKDKMERLPVAVPPLAEQHRIVAKVEGLIALCDQLETSLTLGEEGRHRLLEAVLHEALAPTIEEAA